MFGSRFKSTDFRIVEPALRAAFDRGEIESMADLGTVVHVSSGEQLIAEGAQGTHAFFITAGTAAVTRSGTQVAKVRSGDLVGECALVTGEPCNASVTAQMPITALRFDRQQFDRLRSESSPLKVLSDELVATRS